MDATITLDVIVLLFIVALASGFVDSMAGGGGLLTIPALMAVGLLPIQALATNKLQASGASLSASLYYISKGLLNLQHMRLPIVTTFIGSVAGTLLVQRVGTDFLEEVIPFLMIVIVFYFLLSPRLKSQQLISLPLFAVTAAMGVGFYDGFFGPGTGSFFVAVFTGLMGFSIIKATAHAKLLNCTSNLASLLFFIIGGHVVWTVGLIMLVGQVLGARLGSGIVLNHGQSLVRPLIVCVSLAITTKLIWGNYGHLLQ